MAKRNQADVSKYLNGALSQEQLDIINNDDRLVSVVMSIANSRQRIEQACGIISKKIYLNYAYTTQLAPANWQPTVSDHMGNAINGSIKSLIEMNMKHYTEMEFQSNMEEMLKVIETHVHGIENWTEKLLTASQNYQYDQTKANEWKTSGTGIYSNDAYDKEMISIQDMRAEYTKDAHNCMKEFYKEAKKRTKSSEAHGEEQLDIILQQEINYLGKKTLIEGSINSMVAGRTAVKPVRRKLGMGYKGDPEATKKNEDLQKSVNDTIIEFVKEYKIERNAKEEWFKEEGRKLKEKAKADKKALKQAKKAQNLLPPGEKDEARDEKGTFMDRIKSLANEGLTEEQFKLKYAQEMGIDSSVLSLPGAKDCIFSCEIFEDITDKKSLEDAKKRMHDEIEVEENGGFFSIRKNVEKEIAPQIKISRLGNLVHITVTNRDGDSMYNGYKQEIRNYKNGIEMKREIIKGHRNRNSLRFVQSEKKDEYSHDIFERTDIADVNVSTGWESYKKDISTGSGDIATLDDAVEMETKKVDKSENKEVRNKRILSKIKDSKGKASIIAMYSEANPYIKNINQEERNGH